MWKTLLKLDTFTHPYSLWSQLDTVAQGCSFKYYSMFEEGLMSFLRVQRGTVCEGRQDAFSSRTHRHTLSLALCHCWVISISAPLMLHLSLSLMTRFVSLYIFPGHTFSFFSSSSVKCEGLFKVKHHSVQQHHHQVLAGGLKIKCISPRT